jgi:2-hydroxy-6-oxonona-2,4-dienedioate hydrolase
MSTSTYWVEMLGTEVRFLRGEHHTTRIIEAGRGKEPLILLHGTGGHAENYIRNIQPFSDRFHVIALDFLWHGASSTSGFDSEVLPPLILQVLSVMDQLGFTSANIEGQSLGGWVAALLAIRHPKAVRNLVLTTPMGYSPDPGAVPGWKEPDFTKLRESSLECLRNPTMEALRTRIERIVHDPSIISDEAVAVRHKFYNDPAVNMVQRDVITHYLGGSAPRKHGLTDPLLRTINARTLVYWGEFNLTPPALGSRMAGEIPKGEFHCAKNTGHWAQFENFSEHNAVVSNFLVKNSPPST